LKAKVRGDYANRDLGHPIQYYMERDCFVDACGEVKISPTSNWGFFNTILTASHNPAPGRFGEVLFRPVIVDDNAWITTGCILYNCEIGEGAVLAAGAVVRSRDVPPWTIVEGNPARIIARYNHELSKWVYQKPEDLQRRL
jgi:acetyltransferase-like isoleucine patch superfamily enzyme